MNNRFWAPRAASLMVTGCAMGAVALAWSARAAAPVADTVPRVVPYEGQLALDGTAVHGDVAMRFSVHSTAAPDGAALWTGTYDQACSQSTHTHCKVVVRAGKFAVLLGQYDAGGTSLAGVIAQSADVCLRIAVQSNAGAWVPLGGCQQFAASPYALWSAGGANPAITGNLSVTGDVSADAISANSVATGTANVSSTLTLGAVGSNARVDTTANQGIRLSVDTDNNASDVNRALSVVVNNTTRVLSLDQEGDLSLTGDVSAQDIDGRDVNASRDFTFGRDNTDSGYVRLGDMQIAWGTFTRTGTSADIVVNFPASFSANPVVNVSVSDPAHGGNSINAVAGAQFISTTQFTMRFKTSRSSHTQRFQWMAVGAWR